MLYRHDSAISAALVLVAAGLACSGLACSGPAGTADHDTAPDRGASGAALSPEAHPGSFADNPIVYFVITDRFYNGNPANDRSYGRQPDGEDEIGTFHGGDLAGLTAKLEDGYFRELGVNGLWITAPYEQIHGWVVGGDKAFRHYAYHGYYALDYTVLDKNMGTGDELRAFVDTAHAQGIRVIFDIVMNHPGYADIQTLREYGVDVVWDGSNKATLADYHSYIDYNNFAFTKWWGGDWVRAGLPGYEEGDRYDDRKKQLAYLPDFKTESDKPVGIPAFFARKSDTRVEAMDGYTVRDYLVAWLTAWVREYGVDGFRCDTAKHVDLASWAALARAGTEALAAWKAENPAKAIDDAPFWMTGEVFPHGVVKDEYFDHGFDNLINFDLQHSVEKLGPDWSAPDWGQLEPVYAAYADAIAGDPGFNVLSYLSSHDTQLFPRDGLIAGGTALLLAPGGVQIFYGDESARPPGPTPGSDPQQATRSDMNWADPDRAVLAHWRTLATFRKRHVALAKGEHTRLAGAPYTFSRIHDRDRVVVAIGVTGPGAISVRGVFEDGTPVRDAYTGAQMTVTGGEVRVTPGKTGVVLLERLR